jgi:hypothetical protein
MQVLQEREQTIKVVEKVYQQALDRSLKLSQWGVHSKIITAMKKVRILSDIVVLAQEKHLLEEFHGGRNFKKVGVIEAELNYPLRVSEKYGSMDDNDYFTRRVRIQFDEHLACLNAVESDLKCTEEIKQLMVPFLTE